MVTRTSSVFRAVADSTRRSILSDLRRGPKSVNDIASRFQISRPAVSKHLRILRDAKLVVDHAQGRQRICVLDPVPLRQLDDWIGGFRAAWQERLSGLKRYVEQDAAKQKPKRRSGSRR